jgi:small subunit ribosomal protein S6
MLYESVFILSGQMTQKSAETKFSSLKEKINKSGGKILKTEFWGLRSLAYKIKKNSKGYYYLINSECDTKVLSEFDILVKQDSDFLRFFNIKIKLVDKNPSQLDESKAEER